MPTYRFDQGYWYEIPSSLSVQVEYGRLVRVPLGGRKTDGLVVELGNPDPELELLPLLAVVSDLPVLTPELEQLWKWVALHYVAPLPIALKRSLPPLRIRIRSSQHETGEIENSSPTSLGEVVWKAPLAPKFTQDVVTWLCPTNHTDWIRRILGPVTNAGRSAMIIAPTAVEVEQISQLLRSKLPKVAVLAGSGDMSNRNLTDMWIRANQSPGCLLVGTPKMAGWPIWSLATMVLIGDGRRALKDRPTPTVSVRDLLIERSRIEKIPLFVVGPTPTVETLHASNDTIRPQPKRRLWTKFAVVDRSGSGDFLDWEVSRQIQSTVAAGERVLLFAHRRGYAPAFRCRKCGTLRRCPRCGAVATGPATCVRCSQQHIGCEKCGHNRFSPQGLGVERVAEQVKRIVSPEQVAIGSVSAPLNVASEADLLGVSGIKLAVVVEADRMIFGTNYRATEEALRMMVRVANTLKTDDPAAKTIIQTSHPHHPVVKALVKADPLPLLTAELSERKDYQYPPFGEIMVIEVRGRVSLKSLKSSLSRLIDDELLMGPANSPAGHRWLVQAPDLDRFRVLLGDWTQAWRDRGAIIRIDADPIDL